MNARTSKIARLPLNLRDQLNHRLQSGEPGQPILDWLNQDPAVQQILTQWFHSQPINKQNLSDWRHGGYQDWLRHQARQQNIQRLAEQGGQLNKAQGTVDLCESFSQIVIAEMADELEHLHEITDRNERWKKLKEISRELSRLQHGFNHSRSVGLAWNKYNDQFEHPPVNPSQPLSNEETIKAPRTEPVECSAFDVPGSMLPVQGKEALEVQEELKNAQPEPPRETVSRYIYHRHCGRNCVCPHCHPEDGEYPYSQAVKDDLAHKDHTSSYWNRGPLRFWVTHVDCNCYCDCEKTHPFPNQEPIPDVVHHNHLV